MITVSEGSEAGRRRRRDGAPLGCARAARRSAGRDGPRLLLFREEVERIASPTSLPLPPAWQESWLREAPDWVAALARTRKGVR